MISGERRACRCALGDLARQLAADGADLLLQLAHPGLAGVVPSDQRNRLGREVDHLGFEAVLLDLARDEVLLGDRDLFLLGVAGQLDDLHAVQQRAGDGVELVGGADEEHLRQVERLVEIVVAEGVVLLRVEGLEQRGRGVAAEVASELVDLVEHEDRILHLNPLEVLDDLSGQRANVGAAMAPDLGLVVHTAERDAREFAVQCPRDRPAERGFAHTRRSDEAQDRALHVGFQTAHGEVIQDAVFHLLQAVVVLIEELLRLEDVDLAGAGLRPRQHGQPLDVVAGERVVGRRRVHAAEAGKLLERVHLDLFGHAGGLDLGLEVGDVLLGVVEVAEFLLNRLQLLAQIVVALRLLHGILDLVLDLVAELLDFELLGEVFVDALQAGGDVGGFEELLLVGGG